MNLPTRRSILAAAGAMPFLAGPAHADPPRDLLPGGAFDQFVAQRAAQDQFSGTVLLARHGRPVLIRSYGRITRDDTIFTLASMTKMLTGVAIARLAQQGDLAFHDKLATYVDGFPPDVTIHQLLTHTSGLGRPALGSGPPPTWGSVQEVVDGTMALIRATPPQFTPPGIRHEYSNDGFWILGAVVTKVSGLSYYDYVRENIFTPAGMTRSDFYTKPQVLARRDIARPFWTQRDGTRADFTASPYFDFIGGPDGGAYSTVEDVLRFTTALPNLLRPEITALITSGKYPVAPAPGVDQSFAGYGFRDFVVNGDRVFGHSGGGPGRATNLDIHPGKDWTSVILSNYDTSVEPIVALSRQLISRQK